MNEIEVKARLRNPDPVISKLKSLGCGLGEVIVQKDRIYLQEGIAFEDKIKGRRVLRIREENERCIFTLKISKDNELDCIEEEVEVSDVESMKAIIMYLDFYEAVKVNKQRRKCKYKDYEICIDDVEGLGKFIEVEKISDEDSSSVQEELFEFLISIGIDREDQVFEGYDTLIFNKKNQY